MAAELAMKPSAATECGHASSGRWTSDNNSQLTQNPYCPLSVDIPARRVNVIICLKISLKYKAADYCSKKKNIPRVVKLY
jgi:hypothetical protein